MSQVKRKILFIDRVFQKNMILLFLAINIVMVVSNLVYYWLTMKEVGPVDLKESGIVISNISEIIFNSILSFNVILAFILCVLIIIFYYYVHKKLNNFFSSIIEALKEREFSSEARADFLVNSEFQDIDDVLHQFFKQTDEELRAGDNLIQSMTEKMKKFDS